MKKENNNNNSNNDTIYSGKSNNYKAERVPGLMGMSILKEPGLKWRSLLYGSISFWQNTLDEMEGNRFVSAE